MWMPKSSASILNLFNCFCLFETAESVLYNCGMVHINFKFLTDHLL